MNNENQQLINASNAGDYKLVHSLLNKGIDPNVSIGTSGTALHQAVLSQHYNIIELLTEYNANPNISNSVGTTPMHYAASAGDLKALEMLITHKGNVDAVNKHGNSLLHCAAIAISDGKTYCWDAIDYLLKHKANPYVMNNRGVTVKDKLNASYGDYADRFDELINKLNLNISGDTQLDQHS